MKNLKRHIKEERTRKALGIDELAKMLDISAEAYSDLENYEDELTDCIDLKTLLRLMNILEIAKQELLPSHGRFDSTEEVKNFVQRHMKIKGLTVGQFEDEVGWEFYADIEDPESILRQPIMFFIDLAAELRLDYKELLLPYINLSTGTQD